MKSLDANILLAFVTWAYAINDIIIGRASSFEKLFERAPVAPVAPSIYHRVLEKTTNLKPHSVTEKSWQSLESPLTQTNILLTEEPPGPSAATSKETQVETGEVIAPTEEPPGSPAATSKETQVVTGEVIAPTEEPPGSPAATSKETQVETGEVIAPTEEPPGPGTATGKETPAGTSEEISRTKESPGTPTATGKETLVGTSQEIPPPPPPPSDTNSESEVEELSEGEMKELIGFRGRNGIGSKGMGMKTHFFPRENQKRNNFESHSRNHRGRKRRKEGSEMVNFTRTKPKVNAIEMNISPKEKAEGILIVDKEREHSAFHLVDVLRKLTGIQKIGHAGTLDPFATGVMVMLIGKSYTSMASQFTADDKEYVATLKLGVATDSFDSDGQLTNTSDQVPSPADLETIITLFQGTIQQTPPMFSAKKKNGQRLYELARQGIEVERKSIPVNVSVKVLNYTYPELAIKATVSKGTYIRTLAHDIGLKLGCYAHCITLRRIRSGQFNIQDSVEEKFLEDPSFSSVSYLKYLKKIP